MKIQLTQEQIELLNIGNVTRVGDTNYRYHFLPYYFRVYDDDNTAEIFFLEKLPEELVEYLSRERNYEQ